MKRINFPFRSVIFILISVSSLAGCMSKAQHYYATGDHAGMIREFEAAGDIRQLGTMDLYYVCPAYLAMRNYQKSLQCADELERREKTEINVLGQIFTPSIFKTQAYLVKLQTYLDTGELEGAIKYGQKAYDLAEQGGFSMFTGMDSIGIDIIGGLGVAYAASGNNNKAKEMLDKLDQYSMSILRGYVFEPYRQLQRIRIAVAMKNYELALSICNENEGMFEGKWWGGLPGHRFTYSRHIMDLLKAKAYYELGNRVKAEEFYMRLLKVPNISENSDVYFFSLADLGALRLAQGRQAEGIELLAKAVDEVELQRSSIVTESAKIGFFGDKQKVYKDLIGALFAQGEYKRAFDYAERSKARALVDLLATKKDFSVQSGNEQRVRELLAVQGDREREALMQTGDFSRENTRSMIINVKEQLNQQAGELASLVSVAPMSLNDIQKLIPADETLVEFYNTEEYLYTFVLTSQGLSAVRTEARDLVSEVRSFRESIEDVSSDRYEEISKRLYNKLIKPIEGSLKTPKLIIVAHGALHYLPFYALYDGSSYIIDRFCIRMLPSASVMKYLQRQKTTKPGDILAFGNPDLGNPEFDLAFAQKEAVAVSMTRPRSRVFVRKDATEAALRQYGDGFSYIHFATHGEFNADRPLNSALLLATDAGSDGRLTVNKIYSMKIRAELVTLSACETGLGRISNGDDIVGLTRGFLYAGTDSIVASLWRVNDLVTSVLMTDFYNFLNETDRGEALRRAQLKTKKQHQHPYYWASFFLTGSST